MKEQVNEMLTMQNEMNSVIDENWQDLGWDFSLAIAQETAEMIDHYGWKWWKAQTPDLEQVKLELVDIWHFGLSMSITRPEYIILARWQKPSAELGGTFINAAKDLMADAAVGIFNLSAFQRCMWAVDMTLDELYKLYIAKNVLNKFRQANGYKEGTYVKEWDGKEDNQHLMELFVDGVTAETLYDKLTEVYPG